MSFRHGLAALVFCAGVPAVASAQSASEPPRLVELSYEITFAGFSGFRMDVAARIDGQAYDVESSTFKEGVLRAIDGTIANAPKPAMRPSKSRRFNRACGFIIAGGYAGAT